MLECPRPYACHVIVCGNDRGGERKSCADHGGKAIGDLLKEAVRDRGLAGVRVSRTGCLGQCDRGPNVMVEPAGLHFAGVTIDDVAAIADRLRELVARHG